MKSLIVNIDDVGLSGAINEAAKLCYKSGAITGVSVMACGSRFKEAADMLKEAGKKEVGAHLTLTGKITPCAERSKVDSLLAQGGAFANSYKDLAHKYFSRKLKHDQVYIELSSQVKKIRDAGLSVTHLDSHEHVHMLPMILELTMKLAKEFDVPYVRLPLEPSGLMLKRFTTKDFVRRASLALFTKGGKGRMEAEKIGHNDFFMGHFHAGRVDRDIFCHMLDSLREGVSEIALHPGVFSESFVNEYPWYRNAEKELDLLMDDDWRKRLDEMGVRFLTHGEAVSSSR
ncbi:MAG: ChbG/HpnK family deacetylase [Candidatus Omnitrophota bacterium]|jgi:predicted glycoside hydrolase/deacetylase ChbG (UPF0249 family)